MDGKIFFTIFWSILLAELGDKTQIATIGYAASSADKFLVFLASSIALVMTSFLGVFLGGIISTYINIRYVHIIAGIIFIIIGLITIGRAV